MNNVSLFFFYQMLRAKRTKIRAKMLYIVIGFTLINIDFCKTAPCCSVYFILALIIYKRASGSTLYGISYKIDECRDSADVHDAIVGGTQYTSALSANAAITEIRTCNHVHTHPHMRTCRYDISEVGGADLSTTSSSNYTPSTERASSRYNFRKVCCIICNFIQSHIFCTIKYILWKMIQMFPCGYKRMYVYTETNKDSD